MLDCKFRGLWIIFSKWRMWEAKSHLEDGVVEVADVHFGLLLEGEELLLEVRGRQGRGRQGVVRQIDDRQLDAGGGWSAAVADGQAGRHQGHRGRHGRRLRAHG